MAEYEKQVWNCGDTITADKMNHIEEGIEVASSGGAGLVIEANGVEGTCSNKTYHEFGISYNSIVSALGAAQPIFVMLDSVTYTALKVSAQYSNGIYSVKIDFLGGVSSGSEQGEYIANFGVLLLYSDTADGNMRDINCWGGGSDE